MLMSSKFDKSKSLLHVMAFVIVALVLSGCQIKANLKPDPSNPYPDLVSVATIADLQTLNDFSNQEQIYVQGYWSANDGGGGVFIYQADSTARPDNAMVLTASNNQGRWHRVKDEDEPINVKWFGVRSGVVECQTDRLHQALNYANLSKTKEAYIPEGSYYIDKQLRFPSGINVTGAGMGKTVLWGDQEGRYLVGDPTGSRDFKNAIISNLTLENPLRLVLMKVNNIKFYKTEFIGGFVRFENSSHITIDSSTFKDNQGKAAYASDVCSYVTLTNNTIINPAEGGINLSRHQHSYVANNTVTSDKNIDSGYAGIRLPNDAHDNVVENNTITRTGRGIFVLSGSTNNIIRNNTVSETTYQGLFIQSPNNIFENNLIIDAGNEAIYVTDSTSKADNNVIRENIITDTKPHPGDRFIGLKVYGKNNWVTNNKISREYGRNFKDVSSENIDQDNQYVNKI